MRDVIAAAIVIIPYDFSAGTFDQFEFDPQFVFRRSAWRAENPENRRKKISDAVGIHASAVIGVGYFSAPEIIRLRLFQTVCFRNGGEQV